MENDYTSGFIAGQNSNNRDGDMFGGGCGWFIWVILIFAIFGGGMWGTTATTASSPPQCREASITGPS